MAENQYLLHQRLQRDGSCIGWESEQAVLLPSPLNPPNRGKENPELHVSSWMRAGCTQNADPASQEEIQPRGRLISQGQRLLLHPGSPKLIKGSQSSDT